MKALVYCCFAIITFATTAQAEIYKYQDQNGKWQFTDKKPKDPGAEIVNYKSMEKAKVQPTFDSFSRNGFNYLVVENPFYAPIQVQLTSPQVKNGKQTRIVGARQKLNLIKTTDAIAKFRYRWHIGDPKAQPSDQLYHWPIDTQICARISQGFNGSFSHTSEQSRFAIDIALPVGSAILAAREGTVVAVKDDYHMGGVNEYFLDKANYVSVIHADGTFAFYGHILLGTAAVKPGDKVSAGTLLAKSGSSGFSSGPHLHFVIQKSKGFAKTSVPFELINNQGQPFIPSRNQKSCG